MVRVLDADGTVWDMAVVTTPFLPGQLQEGPDHAGDRSRRSRPGASSWRAQPWASNNSSSQRSRAPNGALDKAGVEQSSNFARK